MRSRATPRLVLAVLVGAALVSGCAVDPRTRVKYLEDEQRRLNTAVQAADQSVQASQAYATELSSPGQASAPFSMYYTPAMLEQLASQMVPYRMSGREFHSKLSGEIVIERLTNFRFISRNRVLCRAHLRGENVRYTGKVPSIAKGQVQAFQKAIADGAVADLEVQLSLEGPMVRAKAEAVSVQLVAKRDPSNESRLQEEMNKRALRTPVVFDMSIAGSGVVPRRVMVTGNHVVITYAP
jgi:outer membrane murein-binding lipoprotein Lpp